MIEDIKDLISSPLMDCRKEYYPISGYFTESDAEKIKEIMNGKTFMNFGVSYSNFAGNCTIIVRTDYEESEEKINGFFINCLVSYMAQKL